MRTNLYRDREDAGEVLAELVAAIPREPGVVVGIPRGGVVVAAPIANRLCLPLTLTFARKLTLPGAPEMAFGALDEDGHAVVDHPAFHDLAARPEELSRARERVAREILRQQSAFHVPRLESFLPESAVILVDDGLATGYTMRAAIAHARRHGARRIVVAVPCASVSAAEAVRRVADDFVCPWIDEEFLAVGAYYLQFSSLTDEQVLTVLDQARQGRWHHAS